MSNWIKPRCDDIQEVEFIQIVPCKVIGNWTIINDSEVFKVTNSQEIDKIFEQIFIEDTQKVIYNRDIYVL